MWVTGGLSREHPGSSPSPPNLASAPPTATLLQPCQASLALSVPSSISGLTAHLSTHAKLPRHQDAPLAPGASSDPHGDARPPQGSSLAGSHTHSGPELPQSHIRPSPEPPLGTHSPEDPATHGPPRVLKTQGIPASETPSPFLSEAAPLLPWLSFNAPLAGGHTQSPFLPTVSARSVRKQTPSLSFPVCEVRTPPTPPARIALGRP